MSLREDVGVVDREASDALVDATTPPVRTQSAPVALIDGPRRAHALSRWFPSGRPERNPVKPVPHRLLSADHLGGAKDPADWTLVAGEPDQPVNLSRSLELLDD